MTDFTTAQLSPSALPISGDASPYQAVEWAWFRGDTELQSLLLEGRWVTRIQGSVTVTAASDNIAPMLVRLYYPETGFENLGYVPPGEQAQFTFDATGLASFIGEDELFDPDPSMRMLALYFTQSEVGTGYTIEDLDVVFHTTDVDPNALLVIAANQTVESTQIADLEVADLFDLITVDDNPITEWLADSLNQNKAVIELEGTRQPYIGVAFNEVASSYGLYLDPAGVDGEPTAGTYQQQYRVRLYLSTGGGDEGSGEETEITSINPSSDLE